jgi:ATP-dependent RNA helicase SUPV3L1/SUV3
MRAARGEEAVRLLWDVCTVPDFRKLLLEVHVDFLEQLFLELARRGRLDDEWIATHLRELEKTDGDVDTLVARIAAVRTWTYVANRSTWLDSPREWQERTRALEDRLSDALHERLVSRFVDGKKGKARPPARPRATRPRAQQEDGPLAPPAGHPFAKLAALRIAASPRALAQTTPGAWVEEVVASAHAELRMEANRHIVHAASGRVVAELVRGASIALPDVRLAPLDDVGAGGQRQLQRRVLAFARDVVTELLDGLRDVAASSTESSTSVVASAAVRGLVHRLEQGLGTVLARDVADVSSALDAPSRAALEGGGLCLGPLLVYVAHGLTPALGAARVALATTWFGAGRALRPPAGGAVSFPAGRGIDRDAFAAIGFPVFGARAVRADIAARVHGVLGGPATEPEIASWLGCPSREVSPILEAMRRCATSA